MFQIVILGFVVTAGQRCARMLILASRSRLYRVTTIEIRCERVDKDEPEDANGGPRFVRAQPEMSNKKKNNTVNKQDVVPGAGN